MKKLTTQQRHDMGKLIENLRTLDCLTYKQCIDYIGLKVSISTARRIHLDYLKTLESQTIYVIKQSNLLPWYIQLYNKAKNLRFN